MHSKLLFGTLREQGDIQVRNHLKLLLDVFVYLKMTAILKRRIFFNGYLIFVYVKRQ
jgi:hypothetical protein